MSEEIEEFVERHRIYRHGLNDGIEKKQREIVLNMYNENLEVETISKYTKLTVKEIKEILESNAD